MILMSSLLVILFLGGWLPLINIYILNIIPGFFWFFIKVIFVLFGFVWVRATLPRYRYDQLMSLGWKVMLPLSLGALFFYLGIILMFKEW
jgi:NADH-quinone oxidoreductase subunit H